MGCDSVGLLSAAFFDNGQKLITGHKDGQLKIWDVASGSVTATLTPIAKPSPNDDEKAIRSLWIDPAGSLAVSGDEMGNVVVWSIADRQKLHSLKLPQEDNQNSRVVAARITAAGDKVVALTQRSAFMLDLLSKKTSQLLTLRENDEFFAMSLASDDTLIFERTNSSCKSRQLMALALTNFGSGKRMVGSGTLELDSIPLGDPSGCSPKDEIIEGQMFGEPKIFADTETSDLLVARWGVPGIVVWNRNSQSVERIIKWTNGDDGRVILLDRKQRLAVAHNGGKVRIYELDTGRLVKELTAFGTTAHTVVSSTDGGSILMLRDAPEGEPKQLMIEAWELAGLGPRITKLAVPIDLSIYDFVPAAALGVGGTEAGEIVLFSIDTGSELRRFRVSGFKSISHARLSPDGKLLAVLGADEQDFNAAALVEAADGKVKLIFKGRDSPNRGIVALGDDSSDFVTAAAFSADGRSVAVGRWNGTAEVWDLVTLRRVKRLPRAKKKDDVDQVRSLSFSPDGRFLLGGTRDSGVFLWDVTIGTFLRTFQREDEWGYTVFSSMAMSHDGRLVAAGMSKRASSSSEIRNELGIKVYDVANGKIRFSLDGHDGGVGAVMFTPDDRFIVSASYDGSILYWDRSTGKKVAILTARRDGRWTAISEIGFFAGSQQDSDVLGIVRGLEITSIDQVRQSLFNPDLVRDLLVGDVVGEVKRAASVVNLAAVLESGPAPTVIITSHASEASTANDLVTVTARIIDRGKGVGRVEWRVNGVTAGVVEKPEGAGPEHTLSRQLALDPGENTIEVVAYNGSNLLASLPARITVAYTGTADGAKSRLHVLAIGINEYADEGLPDTRHKGFGKLTLAVKDAETLGAEMRRAATGLYAGEPNIVVLRDAQATRDGIAAAIDRIAHDIHPRDTFVLFAAGHGISKDGRFYLIPQDHKGGDHRVMLKRHAIGQEMLQDWLANRIKAKRVIVLLDTCESGALIAGHLRARSEAAASEAGVGRLHETTGRPVLTAAATGEFARGGLIDASGARHGVFTWALLDALRNGDTNRDGNISLNELVAHVQTVVPREAKRVGGVAEARGSGGKDGQSARFGSRGEDFVLTRALQ